MAVSFFDYNATTPLRPVARAAWLSAADDLWLNPSSPYRAAARVRARLEAAREALALKMRVAPGRIVFNSGATEGNNAVFAHWAEHLPSSSRIGVGPTEHPSVLAAARHYFGGRIDYLALNASGALDEAAFANFLAEHSPAAISLMAANNETGVMHPWETVAVICRERGIAFHCDASQWVGKLDPSGLGACDYVTACGHKFGGPRGVGFLIIPDASDELCALQGGPQEGSHRAGTEDVASVLALLAALEEAEVERMSCSAGPRDGFIQTLRRSWPELAVTGEGAERLWNTVSLIAPEFASVRWIRGLEKRGFLISAGSACSSGKEGASPVLEAMGMDRMAMRRVVRISGGWRHTEADWQALAAAMVETYQALRREADASGSKVISI